MLVVILVFGSPRDALFGIVLVLNSAIGVIQEWRAKLTLDRLSIVTAARVRVLRAGVLEDVLPGDIVENDAVVLSVGDQVPADGVVLAVQGGEVDEALLTGESAPVAKHRDDRLMSGSVVTAGQVIFRATTVGEAAYTAQFATDARTFQLTRSELQDSINLLLRVITWVMGPVALALFLTEWSISGSSAAAAVATVSGLVGMIPQGLVLLTSEVETEFATGSGLRLSGSSLLARVTAKPRPKLSPELSPARSGIRRTRCLRPSRRPCPVRRGRCLTPSRSRRCADGARRASTVMAPG